MKKSSIKQAPKGRIPAMRVEMTGCMYHTWLRTLTADIHSHFNTVFLADRNTYLSGYLIGPDWVLIGLFSVPKIVPQEHQRQGDTKPHSPHRQHGDEGDGTAGVFAPDEKVDEKSDTKHEARIES